MTTLGFLSAALRPPCLDPTEHDKVIVDTVAYRPLAAHV